MTDLREVKNYVFCPELENLVGIKQALSSLPDGTAHPWNLGEKRFLIVKSTHPKRGECMFTKIDISGIKESMFLNHGNASEIGGKLDTIIKIFPDLTGLSGYTRVMTIPGDILRIPLENGQICCFTVTDQKKGSWFDLNMFLIKDGTLDALHYARKSAFGFRHSGDNKIGSFTRHTIWPDNPQTGSIVTWAPIGYNKCALNKFIELGQDPCLVMVSHQNQTLYLIPLPLEEVTLGRKATVADMLVGEVMANPNGKELKFRVPTKIHAGPVINTGATSCMSDGVDLLLQSVKRSVHDFRQATEVDSPKEVEPPKEYKPVPLKDFESVPRLDDDPEAVILVQNGLGISPKSVDFHDNSQILGFDKRFTKNPVYDVQDLIPLPITGRYLQGTTCAIGENPEDIPIETHDFIVIVGTDGKSISDGNSRLMCGESSQINCIFIVETKAKDPGEENYMNHMNQLNIASLCMAGPCSTAMVRYLNPLTEDGYIYRFLRGMRLHGWKEEHPNFGDVVEFGPDFFRRLVEHRKVSLPMYPIYQKMSVKCVFLDGSMITMDGVLEYFKLCDYRFFLEKKEQIKELFDQLKVILDNQEIRDFITKLTDFLNRLIDTETAPLKKKVMEVYSQEPSEARDKLFKKLSADLKGEKSRLGKTVRFVADALSKLTSSRGVTKNYQSVKAAARANAINKAVSGALEMDFLSRLEWMTTVCEIYFMLCLEPVTFKSLAELTRDDRLLKTMTDWSLTSDSSVVLSLKQDPRTRTLDSDSLAIIAEIAGGLEAQTLARGPWNMTVPQSNQGEGLNRAMLAIPIVSETIKWSDPGKIKWTDICNEPLLAYWRIWVRQLFADCFNRIMDSKSKQIPFLLIHVFLCGMESIASGMSGPTDPDSVDEEDLPVTIQGMRGLSAHLFSTAASTQETINPIYQLTYNLEGGGRLVLPKTDQEWWIYIRFIRLLPYIGWSRVIQMRIMDNFRQLISKLIYNKVLNEAIVKLSIAQKEDKKENKQKVKDPKWISFLHLTCDVLFEVLRGKVKMTKDLAGRLFVVYDKLENKSEGTRMALATIYGRYVQQNSTGDDSKDLFEPAKILLYSYVKHSGDIDTHARKAIRRKIAKTSTSKGLMEIYTEIVPRDSKMWKSDTLSEEEQKCLRAGLMSDSKIEEREERALVAPVVVSLRDSFLSLVGGGHVVQVLDQLENLPSHGMRDVPILCLVSLGCKTDRDPTFTYRQMVEAMIREHKDYDIAIKAGMSVLSS